MQTKPCCPAIDGFFKTIFIGFIIAMFFAGCRKGLEPVLESDQLTYSTEVVAFARLHLPAETFNELNWQRTRTVILADTIFGWFIHPLEVKSENEEFYFVGAINATPKEIVQYKLEKTGNSHREINSIYTKAWVSGRENEQHFGQVHLNASNGNAEITTMSHPSCNCCTCPSTLPDVVVVGRKKEVKKVVYVRAANLTQDYTNYYNMYADHEYVASAGDSYGGAYGGGLDASINLSQFADYVIWKNLFLYLPDDYPGMDIGLHWKWWLDGADQTEDNIDASFFNLEHLRLNREEVLWALHHPGINKQLRDFVMGHEMDVHALIAAKASLRHAIQHLLDKPQTQQHVQILEASYNEFSCCPPNPFDPVSYAGVLAMKIAFMKKEHPNWSDFRCYVEAQLDILQFGLDVVGLIPVFGEVCDLTNGVIYTIRGDGISAGLSFAAVVPIGGWFASIAKWARKVIYLSDGSKAVLTWYKGANNVISFGSENSKQFRRILGLAKGDARQAHHIIPWELANDGTQEVIQKAAQAKFPFHPQDALNGIPLNSLQHLGSHPNYTARVSTELEKIRIRHGANLTPEIAYQELINLTNRIRQAIISNPNTPIEHLIF